MVEPERHSPAADGQGGDFCRSRDFGGEITERILLAGTFGNCIRQESAARIGLVPRGKTVESCGNAAGVGASLILLSDREWEQGIAWAKTVNHVELADEPEFAALFVRNMEF
ncbi:MAG: DUF4445 domain-containing protein [Firmicutes bacterium]|nr:DUF4445 domain-containing protein [Bacillota bacterium]